MTMTTTQSRDTDSSSLIPGLPDDLAKTCLALVPRPHLPAVGAVSKRWMSFITSREFVAVRKEVGALEEWVYVLTTADDDEAEGAKRSRWEVLPANAGSLLDDGGRKKKKRVLLPPMPGPPKAGFGVAVLGGKLLVVGGYDAARGKEFVSDEVYQYDACLNRWTALAKLNVARRDFACAELSGALYAAGGVGPAGERLRSVEAYDPERNEWTAQAERLRRPRWGCLGFGSSAAGRRRLYVLGGRSSFTIGHARSVDVYDPRRRAWAEVAQGGGAVMVTSHAVVGGGSGTRLVCVEWKDQRTLVVFDPEGEGEDGGGGSWRRVPVPLAGSSRTRFCLGVLRGKVLLFAVEEEAGYWTLVYDPDAPAGSEWRTSDLKPSGVCVCSVTIGV